MAGSSPEVVLGEVPVVARLALGAERLSLFLTGTRIIVAHVGKRGAGALATISLLGRLSEALEDLFKTGRESVRKRKSHTLSPESILAADKDNFPLRYDEIVSVELTERFHGAEMTIVTRDDKLRFSTSLDFEKVVNLLGERLGSKLVSKRLSTLPWSGENGQVARWDL